MIVNLNCSQSADIKTLNLGVPAQADLCMAAEVIEELNRSRQEPSLAGRVGTPSDSVAAINRAYDALEELTDQTARIDAGIGDIYLDSFIGYISTLPAVSKATPGEEWGKAALKQLQWEIDDQGRDLIKAIPKEIKRAKMEYAKAFKELNLDSKDPKVLLEGAARLEEAVIHLRQIKRMEGQVKKLYVVADKLDDRFEGSKVLLRSQAKAISDALKELGDISELTYDADSVRDALENCEMLEGYLDRCVQSYSKKEADDNTAFLSFKRAMRPLFSSGYPVPAGVIEELAKAEGVSVEGYDYGAKGISEMRRAYLFDRMNETEKAKYAERMSDEEKPKSGWIAWFFLGLQAMALLRGAGSLLLGHDAAQLKADAEQMHRHAMDNLNPETLKEIENDASFMGRLLDEKWDVLDGSPLLDRLSPEAQQIAKGMRNNLTQPPNSTQIQDARDLVIKSRIAPLLSPFQHRSMSEWIQLFMTPEKEEETKVASVAQKLLPGGATPSSELTVFLDEKGPPTKKDLVLHLGGREFGKDSGLEGFDSLEMLNYVKQLLDTKLQTGQHAQIQKLSNKMKAALELGSNFRLLKANQFVEILDQSLNELAVGDYLFWPGGWVSPELAGGHAIVYEIIRETDDTFAFRVYNQGEGVRYHAHASKKLRSTTLGWFEVSQVEKSNLIRPAVIQGLMELMQAPQNNGKYQPGEMYYNILGRMEGKINLHPIPADQTLPDIFIGICSYSALTALLHQRLESDRLFERLMIELEAKAAWDYWKQHASSSQLERELLLRVARQTIQDAISTDHLSNEELDLVRARMEQIIDSVTQNEWENRATLAKQKVYQVTTLANPADLSFSKIGGSFIELEKREGVPPAPKYDGITIGPFTGPESAKAAAQKLRQGNLDGKEEFVRIAAHEFARSLPLDEVLSTEKLGSSFAKSTSPEQALEFIDHLVKIANDFQHTLFPVFSAEESRTLRLPIKDTLVPIKLLTVADSIARQFSDTVGIALPNMLQQQMAIILYGMTAYSRLDDPELEGEMLKIRKYWKEVDPTGEKKGIQATLGLVNSYGDLDRDVTPSFFGFEWAHAGFANHIIPTPDIDISENVELAQRKLEENRRDWGKRRHWEIVDWTIQYLKDHPDSLEKIFKVHPFLRKASPTAVAIAALADQYQTYNAPFSNPSNPLVELKPSHSGRINGVLPEIFFHLWDLSFVTNYLFTGGWSSNNAWFFNYYKDRAKDLDLNTRLSQRPTRHFTRYVRETDEGNIYFWDLQYQQFGNPAGDGWQYKRLIRDTKGPWTVLPVDGLTQAYGEHDEKLLSVYGLAELMSVSGRENHGTNMYRYRRSPNGRLLLTLPPSYYANAHNTFSYYHNIRDLPRETVQRLLGLSSRQDLQIEETIGYFHNNPTLIQQAKYRDLFTYMLFEQGLLLQEIQKRKPEELQALAESLGMLIDKGYSHYGVLLGNIEVATFFLDLAAKIRQYIPTMMDPIPKLRKHLEDPTLTSKQRSLLYYILARTSEDPLDLVTSAIHFDLHPIPPHEFTPFEDEFRRDLMLKNRRRILEAFTGPDRDRLLNQAVKRSIPRHNMETTWQLHGDFPLFQSSDGRLTVDVLKGRYYELGKLPRVLPSDVVGMLEYRGLVHNPGEIQAIQTDQNSFEFTLPNGFVMMVKDRAILRQIGGHWYQFQDNPFGIAVNNFALIEGNHVWYSAEETLILDRKTDRQLYRISYEQEKATVHKGDLILAKTGSDSAFAFLNTIEDPSWTLAWVDSKSGELSSIELPRFGLSFTVEGKIKCDQLPGYTLSPVQRHPSLGTIENYLLLDQVDRDQSTSQAVVIPVQPYHDSSDHALDPQARPDRTKASYAVFDIERKTQKLIPRTMEGRLHLAMIYLWHHDYKRAAELIRGYGGQRGPFSKPELKLLETIGEIDKHNDDHTPQGVAVKMIAYAAQIRQHLDFGREAPPKKFEGYRRYLHQLDFFPELALTRTEEALVRKYLNIEGTPGNPNAVTMSAPSGADFSQNQDQSAEKSFYSGLASMSSVDNPSLLRPQLGGRIFYEVYTAIQNSNYKEGYLALTGIELPSSYDAEKACNELLVALSMIANGKVFQHASILAQVLAFALTTSDSLLTAEEIQKIIRETHGSGWDRREDQWEKERKRSELFGKFNIYTLDLRPHFKTISEKRDILRELITPPKPAAILEPAQAYEHCLKLMSLPMLQGPVIDNLDPYISTKKPSAEELAAAAAVTAELEGIFQVKTDEPLADAQLKTSIKGIREYGASPDAKPKVQYSLKDLEGLKLKRFEIEQELFLMAGAESTMMHELLKGANRLPADPTLRAEREALLASGGLYPITLDDLALALVQRNQGVANIKKLNPGLSADEIDALLQNTKALLIHATERQRRQAVVEAIKDLETAPADEISSFIGQLKGASEAIRRFDPSQMPEYLVFEYYIGILLQGRQVEGLDKLLQKIQRGEGIHRRELAAVLEMIMGSGKTAVLTPLIALLEANGEQISLVVMPEGLMPEKTQELEERMGRAFGRSIDVLTFDRSSNFDKANLERLIDRLHEARDLGKLVMVSSSSLQSLILRFIEDVLAKVDADRIVLFAKVLAEFRNFGCITFDELDAVADVLKLQIFSMTKDGKEREPANLQLKEATADLLKFMVTDNELAPLVAKPFTAHFYNSRIKPRLLEAVLQGKLGDEKSELNLWIKEMRKPVASGYFDYIWRRSPRNIDDLLKSYLLNQKDAEAFALVDGLSSMSLKNTLAVLKQQISKMIPETFSRRVGEHFGLVASSGVDQDTKWISKPLEKGSWDLGSEHGTAEEGINYSLQHYLAVGIPLEFVQKEVYALRDKLLAELSSEEIKQPEESQSFQKLMKLTGGKRYQLERIGKQEIEEITNRINREDPTSLIDLAMQYAIEPQLKIFPYQLRADAQMLLALAGVVRGFSGTVWNWQTFDRAFKNVELSNTEAKTLHLLVANSPKEVTIIDAEDFDGKLDQLFQGKPSVAIADVGNLFGDVDGAVVARKIVERGPWKGSPYYDKDNQLMVALKGRGSELLTTAGVAKEVRAPFWKQELCTGSDIPLGIKAEAVVTFSRYTMMRDLLQTVWRLRKLDQGQKVRFAVDVEDKAAIIQTLEQLTKQKIEKLELSHLLLYAAYIQAMRIGDDNHRSLDQQLRAELIRELFDVITQPEVTPNEIIEIIGATQDLFLTPIDPNPYNQYGGRETLKPAKEVVEEDLQAFLRSKALSAFYWQPTLKKYCNIEKIEQRLHQIAEAMLPRLAKLLSVSSDSGTQFKVKTNTQTQTETQTQTQTKTKTQVQLRAKVHSMEPEIPPDIVHWTKEKLFSRSILRPGSATSARFSTINSLSITQVKVSDALTDWHRINECFHPRLLTSLNRMPIYAPKEKQLHFVPYDEYEDPVTNFALLIEDVPTGEIALMLIDQDDASEMQELMVNPPKNSDAPKLSLINLETDKIWRQTGGKIENHPVIPLLKAQAKLVNGFLSYTKEEKEALLEFLEDKDVKEFENWFTQEVLGNREQSQERYPHSDIAKIFKDVEMKRRDQQKHYF